MKIFAISAISAWLVQMFEVAFSRRMCCSRVDSVSTNPRLPLRSVRLAHQPARHLPHDTSPCVAITPQYGPPKPSGTPNDCASMATMSASARRLDNAQRDRLRNRHHQQRSILVRDLRDRRAHLQSCQRNSATGSARTPSRPSSPFPGQSRSTRPSVRRSRRRRSACPGMLRVGAHHLAILRMHAARHHHRIAARSPASPSSRPRPPRSNRRTSTRWRPPCRSARRSSSGIRRSPAACPARSPPDTACTR